MPRPRPSRCFKASCWLFKSFFFFVELYFLFRLKKAIVFMFTYLKLEIIWKQRRWPSGERACSEVAGGPTDRNLHKSKLGKIFSKDLKHFVASIQYFQFWVSLFWRCYYLWTEWATILCLGQSYYLSSFLKQSHEFIPQVRKLRHRAFQQLAKIPQAGNSPHVFDLGRLMLVLEHKITNSQRFV